jgi:hypothetical protein
VYGMLLASSHVNNASGFTFFRRISSCSSWTQVVGCTTGAHKLRRGSLIIHTPQNKTKPQKKKKNPSVKAAWKMG